MKIFKIFFILIIFNIMIYLQGLLANDLYNLENITVTAKRVQTSKEVLPIDYDNINYAADSEFIVTPAEVLDKNILCDVRNLSLVGEDVYLYLRGITGGYLTQRVLVLKNGRPLNDSYLGSINLGDLVISNISNIEVLQGPGSSIYGSNAVSGVIKLNAPKNFIENKNIINLGYGTYNTNLINSYVQRKINNDIGVNLNIFRYKTDGYRFNSDKKQRDWYKTNYEIGVEYNGIDNYRIRYFSGYDMGTGNREPSEFEKTKKYFHQININSENNLKLVFYFNRNVKKQSFDDREYKLSNWGFHGTNLFKTKFANIIAGGEIKKNVAKVPQQNSWLDKYTVDRVFFIDLHKFTNYNLIISGGVRYDNNSSFKEQFSHNLGFVYKKREVNFRLLFSQAFRAPSISDLYLPKTYYYGKYYVGNEQLSPEKLDNFEFEINYDFIKDISLSYLFYYQILKNGWEYHRSDYDTNLYQITNITAIKGPGHRISLNLVYKHLKLFLGMQLNFLKYDKYESKPEVIGNYIEQSSKCIVYTNMVYNKSKIFLLKFYNKYVGPRYTDVENSNNNKLSEYIISSLTGTYHFSDNFLINLKIDNIFDKKYKTFKNFYMPGRNIMGQLSVLI